MVHENGYDLFASVRQCGGPHTLTVPHRKLIKMPNQMEPEAVINSQVVPTSHK